MNILIKGDLVMTNVADKDIDMYVKAGWKLNNPIITTSTGYSFDKKKKKQEIVEEKLIEDVEDTTTSDTIEE